ncbi:MAG: DUF885 domain-containing protein [Pyrinomonadaceae bacterium]
MRAGKLVIVVSLSLSCLLAWPFGSGAVVRTPLAKRVAQNDGAPLAWVARSNRNAQVLLEVMARFDPEGAGQLGVEGHDEQVVDLKPGYVERSNRATKEAVESLKGRLASEKDPAVKQDLEILIRSAETSVRGDEISAKYDIPYFFPARIAFSGLRALLDDQVAQERRKSALVRLRRYAGMEEGYTPLAVLAEQRTRERLKQPGLVWPIKAEVEKNLANTASFIDGITKLFENYQISGYTEAHAKLKEQVAAYDEFVRREVLPKARTDFRLPPEEYAYNLERVGVDLPPAELAAKAHAAFTDIQKEMQTIAARIAQERGFKATGYRDVIRELKKEQLIGEAILPHYQKRVQEIEAIVRREHLVTLPARQMRIRLASEAESAASPAPNMRPPRLIGNTGELGEFVLPLNIPAPAGSEAKGTQKVDDFTFAAASWTLTSHEGRPGHEMQFASMIEKGVSTARGIFAFNSTNVEGWGLYSEAIMKPHMPLEGQLISLQHRLLRAARAFLDPELQAGKVTPAEALRVLKEDVVLSDPMANQEVERYTFRAPGQATAYFYGFTQLMELRADTERAMGAKFDQQKFHDFILAQGLLPPRLLRKAVTEEFMGQKKD